MAFSHSDIGHIFIRFLHSFIIQTRERHAFFSYVQKHLKKCLLNLLFSVATTLKTILLSKCLQQKCLFVCAATAAAVPHKELPFLLLENLKSTVQKSQGTPHFFISSYFFSPIFIRNGLSGRVAINKPFYLSPVKG